EKPRHKTRNRLTHRDRSEYKTDSSVMAVCKPVTIPGMTGHVRRNTHKSNDKFMLHFKNLLERRVGPSFYPCIDQRLLRIDGISILSVECQPSRKPCYLDGEKFFVRTNPATDKLEGPQLVEYIQNHFKQN
ncbi:MAG: hypothetical protein ABJM11_19385, partial [Marinobacter sp.]|uniref:hypothetical protein n=1 Tax=Marinobacter sp. TaxID=50741 RepID=UPI003299DF8C